MNLAYALIILLAFAGIWAFLAKLRKDTIARGKLEMENYVQKEVIKSNEKANEVSKRVDGLSDHARNRLRELLNDRD